MKRFYSIKVKEIEKNTKDTAIVSLAIPTDLADVFTYKAGQYVTIKKEIAGEDLRRSYSLCSSPLDGEWKIGIKKIEDGRFSSYANEVLAVGDSLEIMPPDGKFYIDLQPSQKRNHVAFAAGSGITPIISLVKTHLEAEPQSTFKLFYVNQSVASIALKEELEALKNQYMNRFELFHFLTREHRSTPLLNGRIDAAKLERIFQTICDTEQIDHYFMCGPEPMIHLINDFLTEKKVPKSSIHFELFGTGVDTTKQKKKALAASFEGKTCNLVIIEGGKQLKILAEQGGENVLDVALKNAADLPFACKGGVCATCRAKVINGSVDMLLSYGLEQDEIDAGYILTCQSIPTSDDLVVDFDV